MLCGVVGCVGVGRCQCACHVFVCMLTHVVVYAKLYHYFVMRTDHVHDTL